MQRITKEFNQNKSNVQKIIVNGVLYASVLEASEALGCSDVQLRRHYREFLQGSFSEKEVGLKIVKKVVFKRVK